MAPHLAPVTRGWQGSRRKSRRERRGGGRETMTSPTPEPGLGDPGKTTSPEKGTGNWESVQARQAPSDYQTGPENQLGVEKPFNLQLVSWNSRGWGQGRSWGLLAHTVKKNKPDFITLQETRLLWNLKIPYPGHKGDNLAPRRNEATKAFNQLLKGYTWTHSEGDGTSAGVAVGIRNQQGLALPMEAPKLRMRGKLIAVKVRYNGESYQVFSVYRHQ